MVRVLCMGILLWLLLGCGSSDTPDKPATIINENEKNLTLIDSSINGIEYSCGQGYSGLTGMGENREKAGSFICPGPEIKFSIGSLILGTIPEGNYTNNEKIYPQRFFNRQKDLYKTNEVLNFAQFIQSIDDDGDISEVIIITEEMRNKILKLDIKTIDWKKNSEVLGVLKKLDKDAIPMNKVERHLLINTGVPYIAPKKFTIKDNLKPNSKIGDLNITNKENITKIEIIKPLSTKEYFEIRPDGGVYLKKEVDYIKQLKYNLTVRAYRDVYSNPASLTINVDSSIPKLMNPIKTAIILYPNNDTILYTNQPNYEVTIKGRKDTNIYWDGSNMGIMPKSGVEVLKRKIFIKDTKQKYKIKLNYDNGRYSPDATLYVWYDNKNPILVTATEILVPENTKLAKAIDVKDDLKNHGLNFRVDGGADKELFIISSTTGLLEFKKTVDYENKQDKDKNNIYEVQVKVTDKAGNSKSKLFKVKVENRESRPTIANSQFSIYDSKNINEYIEQIKIKNDDSIITSIELFDNDKNYFRVTKEGKIYLNKKVFYQTKNNFLFRVQVTNNRGKKSNIATITINVKSADIQNGIMDEIKAPLVNYINSNSKIYTNKNSYSFEIDGRKGTNVYLGSKNKKLGTINKDGKFIITQSIDGTDRTQKDTIYLGYDNGVTSKVTNFNVIKDTIAPNITTSTTLEKEENIKVITNIEADDINKREGLTFILKYGKDSQLFTLLENGELSFKNLPDFEEPLDHNRVNNYELDIKVVDKAGNSSTIALTITLIDILDSKPIIKVFDKEISTSLIVGETIGKIDIDDGDSEITSLYLNGQGKEYFTIHSNGEIVLIKRVETKQTFNLEVIAINEFGETHQTVMIRVTNDANYANVKIEGTLSDAKVNLIRINGDNSHELIDTDKTNNKGNLNLKTHLLDNNLFYIYELSGGVDISTNKGNQGLLRLIAKGSWLKETSNIMVTPLSEMLYDYVAYYLKNEHSQLDNKLQESSKALLEKDLTGDSIIDVKDVMIFDPINNYQSLNTVLKYNNSYQTIVDKIMLNDSSYIKTLFNAKVVKSFVEVENSKKSGTYNSYKGELKLSGSIAYYHLADTFYTYDIYNKKILGSLILETQDLTGIDPLRSLFLPSNAFNIQIYLDLKNNRAYVVNLNEKIFIIDISDLKNPIPLGSFRMNWGNFIALTSNHHLYTYSNEMFIGSFDIYNATDPNNVNRLGSKTIKEFTGITDTHIYSFSTIYCTQTKIIEIRSSKIKDITNDIEKVSLYSIPSNNCKEEAYFDNNYMYVFNDSVDSFQVYQLIEDSSTAILIDELSLKISKVLNNNSQTIYAYSKGNDNLYFIDISDINNLKIKETIPYKYNYNSLIYFGGEDNLNITIQDNFIVESSRLIDLNIHRLSAIYTERTNGINMSLFDKH